MTPELLDRWVFQTGDTVAAPTLFVFGTAHHVPEFAARIRQLWDGGTLRHLVVSGHRGEAEAIGAAARALGIDGDAIELETRAGNTLENVRHSEALLRRRCPRGEVRMLAKLHAAPRCLLTMRKVFPGWRIGVDTVDYLLPERAGWRENHDFRAKLVGELRKVACYAARGDIATAPDPHHAPAALLAAADALEQAFPPGA